MLKTMRTTFIIIFLFQLVPFLTAEDPEIPGIESEQVTIARAIMDLQQAESPDVRKGAVMLLAKYPTNQMAVEGMRLALGDESPLVRRAAVVSFIERRNRMLPESALELILSLKDPDPQVRRSVAAALPQLLVQQRNSLFPSLLNPQNLPQNPQGTADPQLLKEALLSGLQDPIDLVRLQVLKALRYSTVRFQPPEIQHLLLDTNPEVRIAAIEELFSIIGPQIFLTSVVPEELDPDPRVRRLLSERLLTYARFAPEWVRRLAQDDDPEVRLNAAFAEYLLRPRTPVPGILLDTFRVGHPSKMQLTAFLSAISQLPGRSIRSICDDLLDTPNLESRIALTRKWLESQPTEPTVSEFTRILNDSQPRIRKLAIDYFQQKNESPPPELLIQIAESADESLRLQSFTFLQHMDPAESQAFLLEMLPDPSPNVRRMVLLELSKSLPPSWKRIFSASLRDPEAPVRSTAIEILLSRTGEEGIQLARSFAETYPDAPASLWIKARLQ